MLPEGFLEATREHHTFVSSEQRNSSQQRVQEMLNAFQAGDEEPLAMTHLGQDQTSPLDMWIERYLVDVGHLLNEVERLQKENQQLQEEVEFESKPDWIKEDENKAKQTTVEVETEAAAMKKEKEHEEWKP